MRPVTSCTLGLCPTNPSMVGIEGPYTSASIRPTRAPSFCSPSARLTATVLFPTPPLPDPTAMMCLMWGTALVAAGASGFLAIKCTLTWASGYSSWIARVQASRRASFPSCRRLGTSSLKLTSCSATCRSCSIPVETISRPVCGSLTCFRASRMRVCSIFAAFIFLKNRLNITEKPRNCCFCCAIRAGVCGRAARATPSGSQACRNRTMRRPLVRSFY